MSVGLLHQLNESLRLWILQTLALSPGYRLHEYLLLDRVRAMGLGTTRDVLRAQVAWLAEQGLVEVEEVEGAMIPRLTGRGQDTATGLAEVPGVARPRP